MKHITILPSKSDAHRALIAATLAGAPDLLAKQVRGISKDIDATMDCMNAMLAAKAAGNGADTGAEANADAGSSLATEPTADLYCGESGSTMRFLLPVTAALGVHGIFHPEGRLPERPLSPLREELEAHGCKLSPQGQVPFHIEGQLQPGDYHIAGNVSSQYITGLLFALPVLNEESRIHVSKPLQSAGYVDMTLETLNAFGVHIQIEETAEEIVYIVAPQKYTAPESYHVEGDWSNAAFWVAAGVIGPDPITIHGLRDNSRQGDKAIIDFVQAMGADVTVSKDPEIEGDGVIAVSITPSREQLEGIALDVSQVPDMVPSLALIASLAHGETVITGAERLRIKESDRLQSITSVLKALGADITELPDGLIIQGLAHLNGGKVDSFNDHRIAMMAAIASIVSEDPVSLTRPGAVAKSYPDFYERLAELGYEGNLICIE